MPDTADVTGRLFALLIGIDRYQPSPTGGRPLVSLGGCVRDVALVERFLRERMGIKDERLAKLTAPLKQERNQGQAPTYQNILKTIQNIGEAARSGDQVYIHYSGHGGWAPTLIPEVKGEHGLDQVLVPVDVAGSEPRFVRDVELSYLIGQMTRKGVAVTLVLDCGFNGGGTRGGDAAVRGVGTVDVESRTTALNVKIDELGRTWKSRVPAGDAPESSDVGALLPLASEGGVLIAAAQSGGPAYEFACDGEGRNGVLTYWLLDALKLLGPGLTFRHLHQTIVTKVHSQFVAQTPLLLGERDAVPFGVDRAVGSRVFAIKEVEVNGWVARLDAKPSDSLRPGTLLAIYPSSVADFTQFEHRIAMAEVAGVNSSGGVASVVRPIKSDRVVTRDDVAVRLDPASVQLLRKVRLIEPDTGLKRDDRTTALRVFENVLLESDTRFIAPAAGDETADFQVAVDEHVRFEIADAAGVPIPKLPLPPRIIDPEASAVLVRWLEHLSRYRAILQLDNADPYSPLARLLRVELRRAPGYSLEKPQVEDLSFDAAGVATAEAGEWIFLKVENRSAQVLNVGVLDFQDDGQIVQVFPTREDTNFWPIQPGQAWLLPLQMDLPRGVSFGSDVIKVLGTVSPTSFRWLELPELGQPVVESRRTVQSAVLGGSDTVERFLASFVSERPRSRELSFANVPSDEWVVAQVEVRVRRTSTAGAAEREAEPPSLSALSQEVSLLYQAGKYGEAIAAAERLVNEARARLGEDHPDYANALNNLGLLYYEQDRFEQARPLLEKALEIREKHADDRPLDLAGSLNSLAALHRDTGNYKAAEQLYLKAIDLWNKTTQGQLSEYPNALLGLATLYSLMGRYDEAESRFRTALQVIKSAYGESHPSYATALNNLAGLYKMKGNLSAAEPLYAEAAQILERIFGPQHPRYANALNNLAMVELAQGRLDEAEQSFQKVLEIQGEALGKENLEYATTLNNLATLFKARRNYSKAARLYEKAIAIRREHQTDNPRDYASSLTAKADLMIVQKKGKEATRLYQEALQILEKALGPHHPDVAIALRNLAAHLIEQGRAGEAADLYRRALAIDEAVFGSSHLNLVADLEGLQAALAAAGAPAEERRLHLDRIVDILETSLGSGHELTQQARQRREALK